MTQDELTNAIKQVAQQAANAAVQETGNQVAKAAQSLPETKPALHSMTVWGGLAAILAGLGNLALIAAGLATPDTAYPAIISIWGGAQAIWGRYKAVATIV